MRGLTTASGQDTLCGNHARKVIRVGLTANQNDLAAFRSSGNGVLVIENNLANGSARRSSHSLRQQGLLSLRVELREHQLGKLLTRHASKSLIHIDQALVNQLGGDTERGGSRTLTNTRLQHPQLAVLNRELNIAQILVVLLELIHDCNQLVVGLLVMRCKLNQRLRITNTRHNVFTLGVHQNIAVHARVAGRGVTREANTRARILAHVAKHHGLNVHSRT